MNFLKKYLASFTTREYLCRVPASNPFVMEPLRGTVPPWPVSVREEKLNPAGLQLANTGGLIIEENVCEPRSNTMCWTIPLAIFPPPITLQDFPLAHPKPLPPFVSVLWSSDESRPLSPFAIALRKVFLACSMLQDFCFEIHHSFVFFFICIFVYYIFELYC